MSRGASPTPAWSPLGLLHPAILHDDRLVGKLDAAADRKASVLQVNAIHENVKFTRTITKAVQGTRR